MRNSLLPLAIVAAIMIPRAAAAECTDPEATYSAIEGDWADTCHEEDGYTINRGTFSEGAATYLTQSYTAEGCAAQDGWIEARLEFEVGELACVEAPEGAGDGVTVPLELWSLTFKPMTAAAAAQANYDNACGYSDWQAGVERELMGLDCSNIGMGVIGPMTLYQNLSVAAGSPDRLFSGDMCDGAECAGAIDLGHYLERQ